MIGGNFGGGAALVAWALSLDEDCFAPVLFAFLAPTAFEPDSIDPDLVEFGAITSGAGTPAGGA